MRPDHPRESLLVLCMLKPLKIYLFLEKIVVVSRLPLKITKLDVLIRIDHVYP